MRNFSIQNLEDKVLVSGQTDLVREIAILLCLILIIELRTKSSYTNSNRYYIDMV